jgi:SAM-dependent methyltransferase
MTGTGPGASRDARAFFDAIAGRYERSYALTADVSRQRMPGIIARLPTPPARVLDLGVGSGRELSALLDAGFTPTGLDISEAMLDRGRRRARPVALVHADFWEPLPFSAGAFDAALALHGTLAHPPDAGALARLGVELARVVGKGGVLVAEAPAPAWLDHLGTQPPSMEPPGDRRVRRTGPRACVYEDLVTGASIGAVVLDDVEWRSAFGPSWRTMVEPLDAMEWLVVARRV